MLYTIIPDIHADLDRLNWSVTKANGSKMIFLGDLIDAGKIVSQPNDLGVLRQVSKLISEGQAFCILGNHELNAILFHRRGSISNAPLRKHQEKNVKQHKSFIEAFGIESSEALSWTKWMLDSMPLWLEIDGLRIAHACWSENAISIVNKRRPTGHLQLEDLDEIASKATEFAKAVETITSGPEAKLPAGYSFLDNAKNIRDHVRLSWWGAENTTWQKAALSVPDLSQLPDANLPEELLCDLYNSDAVPVLVGHYKMQGVPEVQSANATSLDYPKTKCVYRWSGESTLTNKNLISDR